MKELTAAQRLRFTVLLFAAAILLVGAAAATHTTVPLFLAWLPLLAVAWVLSRPRPGERAAPPAAVEPVDEDEDDWDDDWDQDEELPDSSR